MGTKELVGPKVEGVNTREYPQRLKAVFVWVGLALRASRGVLGEGVLLRFLRGHLFLRIGLRDAL
jgi:hypothetical protein